LATRPGDRYGFGVCCHDIRGSPHRKKDETHLALRAPKKSRAAPILTSLPAPLKMLFTDGHFFRDYLQRKLRAFL
jgi:hypothetical protein